MCSSDLDALDYLPLDIQGRDQITNIVDTLAKNIVKYQDIESGVWWQVTDQGNRQGNYLESSASALFVYFLSKSINKWYISSEKYLPATKKAFEGMTKEFIKEEANGTYTLTNCCAVAGLGGKGQRDGSFAYYINEPIIENDPKSVGSFILASIEFEKLSESNK